MIVQDLTVISMLCAHAICIPPDNLLKLGIIHAQCLAGSNLNVCVNGLWCKRKIWMKNCFPSKEKLFNLARAIITFLYKRGFPSWIRSCGKTLNLIWKPKHLFGNYGLLHKMIILLLRWSQKAQAGVTCQQLSITSVRLMQWGLC